MTRVGDPVLPQAVPPAPQSPATLQDCDREPIHIPGHIQPHGALLVFDAQARLTAWSANATDVLGLLPLHLGEPLDQLALPAAVAQAVHQCISEAVDGDAAAQLLEARLGERDVDVVVHGHAGRFLLEFEHRAQSADEIARFALHAHRAIERLKRQRSREALLQVAVDELRTMTGFDRVMAYVFRHDDSGDVVAEARRADLEAWVGRRYPASDIPAQARRLYTLNTLRLIANARYAPVPVLAGADDAPLDMTHSVLRSVSPIHLEYLANMGVAASMSVSIVVQGRLWGMLACHHHQPRLVPYAVRMACDVLAQVLAVTVQGMQAREHADMARSGATLHADLVEAVLHDDDMLQALAAHAEPLAAWLGAEGLGFVQGGRVLQHGPLPEALLRATAAALQGGPDDLVLRHTLAQWPEAPAPSPGPWVGLLALRVDPATELWLLAWRREQVETVRWGGRPEKPLQHGPSGARLTPRGSFDEWRETVRGAAVPWEAGRLQAAQALMAALHRAGHARHAELERARTQMLAVLGHDLRDPLHSIAMAAHVLQHDEGAAQGLGRRIGASSGRMQRLVGQVLDLSRLRSGLGLGLKPRPIDMAPLLEDLVDEARVANPGIRLQLDQPPQLMLQVDPDRMAQALGNLLGNALHHGRPGEPVRICMAVDGEQVRLEVRNVAPPIPDALLGRLFSPFKRATPEASDPASRHAGLGLGLYIAHEIVTGHGGRLDYRFEAPEVVFSIGPPLSMLAATVGATVAAVAPDSPDRTQAAAARSRLAVLVVDDHVDNAEVMAEVLAMEGHHAQAATSPDEALRLAQAQPWDVIVLDVQMPGLDGVELAQRLRTLLQPPPRLLALTGRSIAELGDGAAFFETVLRKPVDIDQFLRIVRRA